MRLSLRPNATCMTAENWRKLARNLIVAVSLLGCGGVSGDPLELPDAEANAGREASLSPFEAAADAATPWQPDLSIADAPVAPPPGLDAGTALVDVADLRCAGATPPLDFDLVCGCNAAGKIRCDGTCSEPDDGCIPSGQWFQFSNMFLGEGRVLDTWGGPPPNGAFMNVPCCSGSAWSIAPAGGTHYRLTNQFLGPERSLEVQPDGARLFMGNTSDASAQLWSIRSVGNGYFRITSKLLGPGRSLDTANDQKNDPHVPVTGNYSGQFWRITKIR
jgi:hypothetical protein